MGKRWGRNKSLGRSNLAKSTRNCSQPNDYASLFVPAELIRGGTNLLSHRTHCHNLWGGWAPQSLRVGGLKPPPAPWFLRHWIRSTTLTCQLYLKSYLVRTLSLNGRQWIVKGSLETLLHPWLYEVKSRVKGNFQMHLMVHWFSPWEATVLMPECSCMWCFWYSV